MTLPVSGTIAKLSGNVCSMSLKYRQKNPPRKFSTFVVIVVVIVVVLHGPLFLDISPCFLNNS